MTSTEPRTRRRVVIVGAGFGGIAAAIELECRGIDDFVILERGAEIGGVWRDNTYPGAGCDVPSPYYSYSFAPNPAWPRRFSRQPDIQQYLRDVVERYRLTPRLRLNTAVISAEFDQAAAAWTITTSTGEVYVAEVFVPATGQLSNPSDPCIPGADSFEGVSFHSARWRHDTDLAGLPVAVIGTGASAVQLVPEIQPRVARLVLFQRSAPYIVPKPDRVYGGAHHAAFRRIPLLQRMERFFWWAFFEVCMLGIMGNRLVAGVLARVAGRQLRRQVPDSAARARLTPDYEVGCKRILFSDDFYPALSQPNADVVTASISEITPTGIRTADGVTHDVDVIIYATGFAAQDFLATITVTGLDGADLHKHWAEGARAYLGLAVPGFPNMFLMYGPNTNVGSGSIVYMLEAQARYVAQAVERLTHLGPGRYLDVRPHVEEQYDKALQDQLRKTAWTTCQSWYRNATGRVTNNWPRNQLSYRRRTATLALSDYEIGRASA